MKRVDEPPPGTGSQPPRWAEPALFVGLLVLYVATLCPTIYSGDAAEFATAGATFGIPHPPGYPLYTLLANIWSRVLFFGDPAWRLNVLSAVAGAATATLWFRVLCRTALEWRFAALAAATVAIGATFWSQALISEVYVFDALLLAVACAAAVAARRRETLGACLAVAVACSLWLSHRNVNLLYLPAPVLLAWPALRRQLQSTRGKLLIAGAAVVPYTLLVLYLPIASAFDPALDTGDPESLSRLWEVLSAAVYRRYLFAGSTVDQLGFILGGLPRQIGLALLLVPFGAVVIWRLSRGVATALLYLGLANLAFASSYGVPDVSVFVLPAVLVLGALAGHGAAWLGERTRPAAVLALLVIAGALLASFNLVPNDLRQQTLVRDFARDALRFPRRGAVVMSHVDTVSFSLWYVQVVERFREDLLIVSRGRAVDWHQEQAARRRPDLDLPRHGGADAASRWPALIVERNAERAGVYITADIRGYFSRRDALALRRRFVEVPAGLLTQIVPRNAVTPPARVVSQNERFWGTAWRNARAARAQTLSTDMTALLLHYASMRLIYARWCLLHGQLAAARRAAQAVHQLDTAPLIALVNRSFARQRSRYHMTTMPQLTVQLLDLLQALEDGRLTLDQVRRRLSPRRPRAGPRPPAGAVPRPPAGPVASTAPTGSRQADQLNRRGIALAQSGRLEAALKAFDALLARRPAHRGALFNRAKVLAALGRGAQAERAYRRLLRLAPGSVPALIGLAELVAPRDPVEARRLYRRAARDSRFPQFRELIARRLRQLRGRDPGPGGAADGGRAPRR